jgi:hypothetical protein
MTEILDSSLSKPRLRRQRNSQLKTVGGVLSELGKVYRAYTNGNITAVEAQTRRALLAEIRTTIEGADVAERMNQIELLVLQYRDTVASSPPRLIAGREVN